MTNLYLHRTNRCQAAYSLLELLIALGLLGALLAVAWSLLGTYRGAEERGWNLSQRTQSVRLIRQWLERDLFQIAVPEGSWDNWQASYSKTSLAARDESESKFSSDSIANPHADFQGNPYGFATVIRSSVDPIPFLDMLFDRGEGLSVENADDKVTTGPLLPPEQVSIEYRLRPAPDQLSSPAAGQSEVRPTIISGDSQDWLLVRTVRTESTLPNKDESQSEIEFSERILTGTDLYRLEEQDRHSRPLLSKESVIAKVSRAQFAYFDGRQWKSSWASQSADQLPRAVAITFDLASGLSLKDLTLAVSPEIESDTAFDSLPGFDDFSEPDSSTEIDDQVGLGDSSSRPGDVRIVVRLWQVSGIRN